jgi:hypothetical protein
LEIELDLRLFLSSSDVSLFGYIVGISSFSGYMSFLSNFRYALGSFEYVPT